MMWEKIRNLKNNATKRLLRGVYFTGKEIYQEDLNLPTIFYSTIEGRVKEPRTGE